MKLNEFTKCAKCGAGMAENHVHFYRVHVEHMIFDAAAVKRAAEMEMAFGPVAATIGLDEDLAMPMFEASFLLCGECGLELHALADEAGAGT